MSDNTAKFLKNAAQFQAGRAVQWQARRLGLPVVTNQPTTADVVRLPDGNWARNEDLESIRTKDPAAYKLIMERGFEAYQQSYNEACQALEPYKTAENRYDLAKALQDKISTEQLELVFGKETTTQVRTTQAAYQDAVKAIEPYKVAGAEDQYDLAKALEGKVKPDYLKLLFGEDAITQAEKAQTQEAQAPAQEAPAPAKQTQVSSPQVQVKVTGEYIKLPGGDVKGQVLSLPSPNPNFPGVTGLVEGQEGWVIQNGKPVYNPFAATVVTTGQWPQGAGYEAPAPAASTPEASTPTEETTIEPSKGIRPVFQTLADAQARFGELAPIDSRFAEKYTQEHPEQVVQVGNDFFRVVAQTGAENYKKILELGDQPTLAAQLAYIKKNPDMPTPDAVAQNINKQLKDYGMLKGEAQFNKAVELGFVPQGSVFAGVDPKTGGFTYYPPDVAEKMAALAPLPTTEIKGDISGWAVAAPGMAAKYAALVKAGKTPSEAMMEVRGASTVYDIERIVGNPKLEKIFRENVPQGADWIAAWKGDKAAYQRLVASGAIKETSLQPAQNLVTPAEIGLAMKHHYSMEIFASKEAKSAVEKVGVNAVYQLAGDLGLRGLAFKKRQDLANSLPLLKQREALGKPWWDYLTPAEQQTVADAYNAKYGGLSALEMRGGQLLELPQRIQTGAFVSFLDVQTWLPKNLSGFSDIEIKALSNAIKSAGLELKNNDAIATWKTLDTPSKRAVANIFAADPSIPLQSYETILSAATTIPTYYV